MSTCRRRRSAATLACAAFELLSGVPPFHRQEAMTVMYAQLHDDPPPLTNWRPDLPPAVDQVFARALAKVPGERYASCREFADAMRRSLELAAQHLKPHDFLQPQAGHPPTEITGSASGRAADGAIREGAAVRAGYARARARLRRPGRRALPPGLPPAAACPVCRLATGMWFSRSAVSLAGTWSRSWWQVSAFWWQQVPP